MNIVKKVLAIFLYFVKISQKIQQVNFSTKPFLPAAIDIVSYLISLISYGVVWYTK